MRVFQLLPGFLLLSFMALTFSLLGDDDVNKGKPKRPKPAYIGLSVEGQNAPELEGITCKVAAKVLVVQANSPAAKAGLLVGDLILGIDGESFGEDSTKVLEVFGQKIRSFKGGDKIKALILRGDEKKPKEVLVELETRLPPGSGAFKIPNNDKIFPDLAKAEAGEFQKAGEALLGRMKLGEDWNDLLDRLGEYQETSDAFRKHAFSFIHRDPFRMGEVADKLFKCFPAGPESKDILHAHIAGTRRLHDIPGDPEKLPALKTGLSTEKHLAQMAEVLEDAAKKRDKAFANWKDGDLKWAQEHLEALMKAFENHIYINEEQTEEEFANHRRLIALAADVNYSALLDSALSLARFADEGYLKALREDLEKEKLDFKKEILLEKETAFGRVRLAGCGDNRHNPLQEPVALLIDFGGNDFYADQSGASSLHCPNAVLIDMEGNDAHESNINFSQGAGIFGSALLCDFDGDDNYIGMRGCQSFSAMGFGLLFDAEGNDNYRSHAYAQGAALWGTALLIDIKGNDRYESHKYAQALGIAGGIGILTEGAGDDSYYSKGTIPSSYGTPGIFSAFSQGVGLGFRDNASGGIGLLQDFGGKDRMEAGNFSQGGGYYHGWGLIHAGGKEDDHYIGSHYNMSFAAHYAAGTFIEDGGNDLYETRMGVSSGLAWDLCVCWFEDKGGNDSYPCRDFSTGATAHNSFLLWLDRGGKDKYLYGEPAKPYGNDYHGGSSFGFFFDLGGDADDYTAAKTERTGNNRVTHKEAHNIFVDFKGPVSDLWKEEKIKNLFKEWK